MSVLARRDRALTPEETEALLRDRLGGGIIGSTLAYQLFTVHVAPSAWVETFRRCRDEPLLSFDLFDTLHGVDAREDGFDVVAILYSTSTGNRLALRTRCEGGRERPVCPSVTDVFRGADWMERETWDMFGIEFDGHPALEPRILTVENFEGWPLRKDFHLASRVAKPWPGVKEPAELDEDGNVIERVPGLGDAPGPYVLDEAMAAQAIARRQSAVDAAAGNAAAVADAEPTVNEAPAPAAASDAPAADAPAATDPDAAADAARTAEEQRRAQVEARARKAAERAAEDGPAADGPATDGPATDGPATDGEEQA
jgi:NADH:ubiquinone oxidoreductase subunit C